MALKKHFDLLEMYGPDWPNLTEDQSACFAETIHTVEELFGEAPDLYGFVGTQRINGIVGGYFALQYETEEFHYDKQKKLSILRNSPFSRIFFVIFAEKGKVLLQNTNFAGIPLKMETAQTRFRSAVNQVLHRCGISTVTSLHLAPEAVPEKDFVGEFERSTRVVRLTVTDLTGASIPPNFEYYNPQRDRNSIIQDSHRHDYDKLKKVDLTARSGADLKATHMRDMIYASRPEYMVYYEGAEKRYLEHEAPPKLEFRLDTDDPQVTRQQLVRVIRIVKSLRPTYIDVPTPLPLGARQLSLLDEDESN
jgi:hypothetical protein